MVAKLFCVLRLPLQQSGGDGREKGEGRKSREKAVKRHQQMEISSCLVLSEYLVRDEASWVVSDGRAMFTC